MKCGLLATPNILKRMYNLHLHTLSIETKRERDPIHRTPVANERLIHVYKGGQCERGWDLSKPKLRFWGYGDKVIEKYKTRVFFFPISHFLHLIFFFFFF